MSKSLFIAALAAAVVAAGVSAVRAQQMDGHDRHAQHQAAAAGPAAADARQLVHYPDALRLHTLANMRDHLQVLQQIQAALAAEAYDRAAQVAEQRLGMDSLTLHGAHEVARYMPEGMQAIGSGMHRAASRFALSASNAGVTGDVRPALAALAELTGQCVACHAGYRLQ
jgi:hypothetical protein